MIIGKTFTFEAAHWLPHHPGKCWKLHGHTWTVEVELKFLWEALIKVKEGVEGYARLEAS